MHTFLHRVQVLVLFLFLSLFAASQSIYTTVGVIGTATPNGWNASTAMVLANSSDPHQWTLGLELSQGEIKFRANNSWDVNWGGSSFPSGTGVLGGANIQVPAAGFYLITFNDVSGAYKFDAAYHTVGLIGSATATGWNASTPMTRSATDPHSWTLADIVLSQGEAKFRANDDWADNWGGSSFPSGTGVKNANDNIPVPAGEYTVTFNDATSEYRFIPIYQSVGIVGNATEKGWDVSTPMVKGADNHTWTLTNTKLTAGDVKFRVNNTWDINWGGTTFPSGTGVPSGSNIPVPAGSYNITFNDLSLAYNFQLNPIVTLTPAVPTADEPVTITYDASLGTSGLQGASKVYMHSGVVLSDASGTTWSNAIGNWGQDDGVGQMTPVPGQPDKWQITLPGIRQYYQVSGGAPVFRLAMVFRNADGSQTGKSESGGDIFVNINPGDYVRFAAPAASELSATAGQQLLLRAEASGVASTLNLELNEGSGYHSVQQAVNSQAITYTYTAGATTSLQMRVTAQLAGKTVVGEKTLSLKLRQPNTIVALPAGVKEGINYSSDCSAATLVLYAPNKSFVDLIGDFNNWQSTPAYQMNKTPDGNYYWLTLSGLTAGTEYAFNYQVDDSIFVADPYTEKVLDPYNDPFISSTTYPGLKPYPVNANVSAAKNGIMSVLQTCQPAYNWQVTNFAKPDKKNLVTYELHVRDFGDLHSYQMLIDTISYFKRLGINALELMPVNEFSGNDSWGYNPTFYFALDKYYGTKNKFKEFIDLCHKNGIAIILDVVYNQMEGGEAPQGRLYWDKANNRPAANNPWLNIDAPHPYFSYQNDLNHESAATRYLVKRSLEYWLSEYKVDGFRMDAGKGFTQKCTQVNAMCPVANGSIEDYDASRVANLEYYYDAVQAAAPNSYMIIEFLGQQRAEEQEYARHGFMLWGNNNLTYNQATMGYGENSNFSKIVYNSGEEAFDTPSEMGYMESHDEERLMFKNLTYGNNAGSYNIKDLATALQRQAAAAAVFFTVPGPKMIWQFGERGYDISIDASGGRVAAKPPHWEYMQDPDRLKLWNVYAKLINLKVQHPSVFNSTAFNYNFYDNNGLVKWFQIQDPSAGGLQVMAVANFDVVPQTRTFSFQAAGTWYNYVGNGTGSGLNGEEGSSAMLTSATQTITLQPGEFHVYLDRPYTPSAAAPAFNPSAGRYNTAQVVSLATITPGATIHYTMDGTEPTASSPLYTTSITLTSTTTVKAISVADGLVSSPVVSATYSIAMYAKGTFNSWGNAAPMSLENGEWKAHHVIMTAGAHELKFANTGDWSGDDWGGASGTSGTAQQTSGGGPNITFTLASKGSYTLSFNPVSLAYEIVKENIPCTLTASVKEGVIACNGGETTIVVSGEGGFEPYEGTGTYTVHAGPYSYAISDAIGCSAIVSGSIAEPSVLTATVKTGAITCHGGTTNIVVSAAGGTAPYQGTGTFSVQAGPYSFTITDAKGCSTTLSGNMTEPDVLVASSTAGTIQCNGDMTTVTVTANGGMAPYKGTGTFPVHAGTYSFTVSDANGCQTTATGKITEPTALVLATSNNNPQLYFGYPGDQTATIKASASGGAAPYKITISMNRPLKCNILTDAGDEGWAATGGTSINSSCPAYPGGNTANPVSSILGLAADEEFAVQTTLIADGLITITVTDANGCSKTTTTQVLAEDVRCLSGNSGNAKVTLCHRTGNPKTPCIKICVDQSNVGEHLAHGDYLGNCTPDCAAPTTYTTSKRNELAGIATEVTPLEVRVSSNPSYRHQAFRLSVFSSNRKDGISLRIVDATGKLVLEKQNLQPGQVIEVGSGYVQGLYYAEVLQGAERKIVKLIKQ